MIKNIITAAVTALIVALVAVGLVGGNQSVPSAGGRSTFDTVKSSGLVVGTTTDATNLAFVKSSTCNLIGADVSVTASTTVALDCIVAGANATDVVLTQLATTTTSIFGGWRINASKASTTAGFITVILYNGTGANAVPSVTSVGSSTQYLITRSQSTDQGY